MIAELISTPEEFLEETLEFRESEPTQTNLIGSVALSVSQGIQIYTHNYWWIVRNTESKVIGCGFHCAPRGFAVSPMPIEAARVLALAVANSDEIAFPAVHGHLEASTEFLNVYKKEKGKEDAQTVLRIMLLYDIDTLKKPTKVEGQARKARLEDLDLIVEWSKQFFIDAELHDIVDHEQISRDKIKGGMLYLWENEGEPVAMGGHALLVASGSKMVGRVGPIYTPKQYRKKGYGSAITAEITEVLQAQGAKVMLFADSQNPASNAIYQAIGFNLACENAEYRFVE